MSRVCIFAHFDKDNLLDEYVLYYLKELQMVADKIIFVTTSTLSSIDTQIIKDLGINFIERENIGYDFMSYKVGLSSLSMEQYDELIICNDSVYGPIIPLRDIFATMNSSSCDFWGITESLDIERHLQSYFLVFKKNLFLSNNFQSFWDQVTIFNSKDKIIQEYEVGLSQHLYNLGYQSSTYVSFDIKPSITLIFFLKRLFKNPIKLFNIFIRPSFYLKAIFSNKYNITHTFWDSILKNNAMPFIKIGYLRASNTQREDLDTVANILSKSSKYPIDLIYSHLLRDMNCKKIV